MANPKIRFRREDGTEYPDWEKKKFSDIGEVAMCKRVLKEQTTLQGEIPFYKIGTFGNKPDAYISKELFISLKSNYRFPNKGAILISAAGTIGKTVRYNGEDAYFQDSNIVWLEHDIRIMDDFLYQFYQQMIWSSLEGSTIKRLYNQLFLEMGISFPCIEEQKKIADFLSNIDEIIKQSEVELKKLETQKKGVMQKIFSQEVRFKQEDGSDYPDWEEKKLKDIGSYVTGTMVGIKSSYVGTENMRKNCTGVDFDNNNVDVVKGVAYKKEDILISNIRPYLKKVWKADRNGICSSDVLCIRNTDGVTSDFLYTILSQDDFFSYVMSAVKGTKMPRGDKKHIMEANFFIPILEEQQKIASCLLAFDEVIISTKQEIEKWKELKKGLLQQMFV